MTEADTKREEFPPLPFPVQVVTIFMVEEWEEPEDKPSYLGLTFKTAKEAEQAEEVWSEIADTFFANEKMLILNIDEAW